MSTFVPVYLAILFINCIPSVEGKETGMEYVFASSNMLLTFLNFTLIFVGDLNNVKLLLITRIIARSVR